MTEDPVAASPQFVELEHALARERQTQFELRRQLLAADESLDRLSAHCAELEACRANVAQLIADGTRISAESGDPDALWALLAAISKQLARVPHRNGSADSPDPQALG